MVNFQFSQEKVLPMCLVKGTRKEELLDFFREEQLLPAGGQVTFAIKIGEKYEEADLNKVKN